MELDTAWAPGAMAFVPGVPPENMEPGTAHVSLHITLAAVTVRTVARRRATKHAHVSITCQPHNRWSAPAVTGETRLPVGTLYIREPPPEACLPRFAACKAILDHNCHRCGVPECRRRYEVLAAGPATQTTFAQHTAVLCFPQEPPDMSDATSTRSKSGTQEPYFASKLLATKQASCWLQPHATPRRVKFAETAPRSDCCSTNSHENTVNAAPEPMTGDHLL